MYLSLIAEQLADAECRVLAYCLMTNHVHLVVVPERADSLAVLFRRAPEEYRWSSAAAHLGQGKDRSGLLDMTFWEKAGGAATWREMHGAEAGAEQLLLLRRCTYAGPAIRRRGVCEPDGAALSEVVAAVGFRKTAASA